MCQSAQSHSAVYGCEVVSDASNVYGSEVLATTSPLGTSDIYGSEVLAPKRTLHFAPQRPSTAATTATKGTGKHADVYKRKDPYSNAHLTFSASLEDLKSTCAHYVQPRADDDGDVFFYLFTPRSFFCKYNCNFYASTT